MLHYKEQYLYYFYVVINLFKKPVEVLQESQDISKARNLEDGPSLSSINYAAL